MTEFRVLGPIEVWSAGRRVDAGQPRQRAVLAALLADAGRAVPVDTLIDRVWGVTPPRGARPSLHAHITRIRQILQTDSITFAAGCYLLDVDVTRVDLHLFRQLTAQARTPERSGESRVQVLREAVRLWRGEPLSGMSGPWAAHSRQTWRQEYLSAAVTWGQAELRVGNPGAVIAVLSDLAGEHPLTEPLAVVLLRALAADGRPAEALTHYETVRRHLISELGTDPSAELQAVYHSILHGSPSAAHASAPSAHASEATQAGVPAQLPADVSGFTGRAEHLALLDAALRDSGPTVAIHVVSGTAGVGKTALAVHWAHTVAERFPDGQLYVNLRGFDPAGRVTDPAESVRGFLDALGVAHERIPSGLDAQAALYRSLLAGKRILVLLDNARDAEQVRPLLPATAGAVAVVTSRNQLTGLLAAEGAHPVTLDVLGEQEARDLLSRRIGADRTDAEAGAVQDIIAACARLPLALAIAAARARQNSFPLAALAAELVDTGDRLDALDIGDPAVQVRAVFSWSYAALSADAGRLFRLLSLTFGPDISTAAAASLAGHRLASTRRLLAELAQANLIVEHTPGRYVSHDLLRTYAAELNGLHDAQGDRRAATVRLLDHYVHTAHAADRLLYPARDPIDVPLNPAAADSSPESFADYPQAMAWLSAEHPALLAATRSAADTRQDTHAWQLAWTVDTFLYRRGHWHDRVAVWSDALPAAERLGNLDAQACGHRSIARASVDLGWDDDAHTHLHRALALCNRSGNRAGQANVHNNLAHLFIHARDYPRALEHNREAFARYEAVGNLRGQAAALSSMSWTYDLIGDYPQAIVHCRQALEKMRQVGDRRGEADVSDSLGYAYHHLGRHAEAADCYRHALDLVREAGDRHAEAEILVHLGDTHEASGDPSAARRAFHDALTIFTELDHPEAKEVSAKLDGLTAGFQAAGTPGSPAGRGG